MITTCHSPGPASIATITRMVVYRNLDMFHDITNMNTIIHARAVGSTPVEKYLRVASLAIAFYDYLLTLPREYQFYRSQPHFLRMSLACILFILIRYSSILVMIVSNYGVFATSFTLESCRRYYYVSPIMKVVQSMISQAILGIRTYSVSGRRRQVGIFLLAYYTITVSLEWFFNIYRRIPQSIDAIAYRALILPILLLGLFIWLPCVMILLHCFFRQYICCISKHTAVVLNDLSEL
ncbi:hypothetical protein J3A83DRAFT_2558919 [Scleroderma citrinum]